MVCLAALAGLCAGACKREDPAPTKVSEREPLIQPPRLPERTGPFSDPNVDAPGPREGGQLPRAELNEVIEQGREQSEAGNIGLAMQFLRRCANKKPQSVPCEAELGMVLAKGKKYKAHARYYINEAAKTDDPDTPVELYRRLAKAAADFAQFEAAASALGIVANRGEATAQDYIDRAQALQADPSRIAEAAQAYAKAYELDPESHELLRERATLLAQIEDYEKAIELFNLYKDKVGAHSPHVPIIDQRIAELEASLASAAKKSGTSKSDEAGKPGGDGGKQDTASNG